MLIVVVLRRLKNIFMLIFISYLLRMFIQEILKSLSLIH